MILTAIQARQYLFNAGFRNTALNYALQICFCESNFETTAHNTSGEDSRGLMQINIEANPKYSNYDLFNPQTNCDVAFEIFVLRGRSFRDWTCANILGLTNPGQKDVFFAFAGIAIMTGIVLYLT